MSLLFRIVRAGHAAGTHHKLALDALPHLRTVDADLWQRLFLSHARLYLEGAKAPDTEFKDYKNHVLHTRDGYWGGAPEKVRSWYNHLVEALGQGDWPTAAYCAGVLSHYYTDPLHPFHTGQSEAENNIHRAVEWSISRSYDALDALARREFASMRVEPPAGPNWLVQLVCQGAHKANGYYEKLIAHYDISRGVVDPPAGLDRVGQRLVAELIRYAQLGFAAVLDRAIEEANVPAPDVSLAAATLAAVAQTPFKLIARRIADARERRLIEAMYDELIATGTVDKTLSEDDRTVRDLHAQEVLASRPAPPPVSQVFPFKPREQVVTRIARTRGAGTAAGAGATVVPMRPAARTRSAAGLTARLAAVEPGAAAAAAADGPVAAAAAPVRPEQAGAGDEPRFHLTLDSDVVDAPSIGAKTADRLRRHGIATVRDLMKAEPAALAVLLDVRGINAHAIAAWQDQARLVCTVPGLRGTHAQLLVGAGYRSAEAVAAAEADRLCADVLAFAATAEGQRVLRNGDPPQVEKIKGWLEAALSVKAA